MLVDVDTDASGGAAALILGVISRTGRPEAKRIGTGLYEIGHFSFNLITHNPVEQYPDVPGLENAYGTCDSPDQFVAAFGAALVDPARRFCIAFTEIRKADQPVEGGWRWHKWGPYVGAHEPTTEYLFDEPLIDIVFVYHVYEVTPPAEVAFEPPKVTPVGNLHDLLAGGMCISDIHSAITKDEDDRISKVVDVSDNKLDLLQAEADKRPFHQSANEEWLIVAVHLSRNGITWFWRENGGGYTADVHKAGRYTEAAAKAHDVFSERMEVAVPLTEVMARAFLCVSDDAAHEWHRARFPKGRSRA